MSGSSENRTLPLFGEDPPIIEDESRVRVKEVSCSSLIHRMYFGSRSSTEYTINLYKGCSHGCVYCYAPSLVHDDRRWGNFVDVKINAPKVLQKELSRIKKDVVFISSASDPYQPVEAKYKVTRRCLEVLHKHDFPVLILTRSPLVLRDLDIITELKWVRVGFSISSLSDPFYEPGVPRIESRIEALRKLKESKVKTWVSLAPIMPKIIVTKFEWLFPKLKEVDVSAVSLGVMRFNGYEDSRIMFQERTGINLDEAMVDGVETMRNVKRLAELVGLDTSCASLRWNGEKSSDPKMEAFLT